MTKIWPLRSLPNFVITTFGVCSVGLFYYSIKNESKFTKSPVVSEGIKILGLNGTIRNLVGNPISYAGSYSNSANLDENEQYFHFTIKGPKSKTTAQLNSTKMKVDDINKKIQRVDELQNEIQNKNKQYQQIISSCKNMKKVDKERQYERARLVKNQIIELKGFLEAAQVDKNACLRKYYIPELELYQKVVRDKNPEDTVPFYQYLHGIDGLAANLPNKSRITVLPATEETPSATDVSQVKTPNTIDVPAPSQPVYSIKKITQGYLKSRLRQGLGEFSQTELQNYSKHKTQMMYGQHSQYRTMFSIIIAISLGLIAYYTHRSRLTPITGTLIAHEAQKYFFNHPHIVELLKTKKIPRNTVQFSKTFYGGKRANDFSCVVDLDGFPNGSKALFEGDIGDEKGIKFTRFELLQKVGPQLKKVDLLN